MKPFLMNEVKQANIVYTLFFHSVWEPHPYLCYSPQD